MAEPTTESLRAEFEKKIEDFRTCLAFDPKGERAADRRNAIRSIFQAFAGSAEGEADATTTFPCISIFLEDPSFLRSTLTTIFDALADKSVLDELLCIKDFDARALPHFVNFWRFLLVALRCPPLPLPMKGHIIRLSTQAVARSLENAAYEKRAGLPDIFVDFVIEVLRHCEALETVHTLCVQGLVDICQAKNSYIVFARLETHLLRFNGMSQAKFTYTFEQAGEASLVSDESMHSILDKVLRSALEALSTENTESALAHLSAYFTTLQPLEFNGLMEIVARKAKGAAPRGGPELIELMSYLAGRPSAIAEEGAAAVVAAVKQKLRVLSKKDFENMICALSSQSNSTGRLLKLLTKSLAEVYTSRDKGVAQGDRKLEAEMMQIIQYIVISIGQADEAKVLSELRTAYAASRGLLLTALASPVDEDGDICPYGELSDTMKKCVVETLFIMDLPRLFFGLELAAVFLDKLLCPSTVDAEPADIRLVQLANRRVREVQCASILLKSSKERRDSVQSSTLEMMDALVAMLLSPKIAPVKEHKEHSLKEHKEERPPRREDSPPHSRRHSEKRDRHAKRSAERSDERESAHRRERDEARPSRRERRRSESPRPHRSERRSERERDRERHHRDSTRDRDRDRRSPSRERRRRRR